MYALAVNLFSLINIFVVACTACFRVVNLYYVITVCMCMLNVIFDVHTL